MFPNLLISFPLLTRLLAHAPRVLTSTATTRGTTRTPSSDFLGACESPPSTTVVSTGTTAVKSRVKVPENTVLLQSPRLQQCSYRDVRVLAFRSGVSRGSLQEQGPYCLLQGIGRRKDLERLWKRHTFLRWAPCELELSQQPPLESSYQTDFRSGTGLSQLPQRLVQFMQVQPPYANTTYQHNFCQPSRGGHCGSVKLRPHEPVAETLPGLPGIPKPKLLQHYLHAGVSECLDWSQALKRFC
ncbi:uncharacterized protein C3orf84 homolog isoform X1 [Rattus norvegicus]|uniref:uncharacterized protein C3orf84 homolog isoform X1 n=1 Tax=Rattus norvegicus TaxID=10116 RepID=UPI0008103000|eukprot:XP_017451398.1 PREDICTED: uncharacterized protein C3orf84 homolog isoform X1 [Rattus norvegicus]